MSSTERSGLLQKKTGETEKVVEEEAEKEEKVGVSCIYSRDSSH